VGGRRRVLILGGGFAGVHTAMFLERAMSSAERDRIEIGIVSNENYIVFQPLLPEVISGTIETLHCITPIRRLARHAQLYTRAVEAIDLERRQVRLAPGYIPRPLLVDYDQLVICLGTRIDFDAVPGAREHAIPFKYLGDALRLRNEIVHVLEEANIEPDPAEKRKLLTFVVAGGGFSGVECIAELHDFIASAERAYANVRMDDVRCLLLQGADRILPELDGRLAAYAQQILTRRGIEIRLGTRLRAVSADGVIVGSDGAAATESIPARTVVTTIPAAPHPLLAALPLEQVRGRIRVTANLDVAGRPGVWALGDCAAVPQRDGILSPPTAQHALRQARTCAHNVLATLRGRQPRPFTFTGLGSLASLGHRSAVADVMGVRLRGFLAWLFWRSVYLAKFPGIDRQARIATDWLLDLLLPRDITQLRIFHGDAIAQEHFHAGETIFDQGDYGNKLYVIVRGEVLIRQDGNTVATLSRRQVFGEVALVADSPRNAAAIAATDVDLLGVSRTAFEQLVAHLPGTRQAIIDIMRSRGVDPAVLERAAAAHARDAR
jgi:NADH dehydrogenase